MNDMSIQLVMPKAGLTMVEGTIATWKVATGDQVKKGQIVMEFENEKMTIECEANGDGFFKIIAESGTTVKVGEVVAQIAPTKEAFDALGAVHGVKPQSVDVNGLDVAASSVVTAHMETSVSADGHIRATGLARNMAKGAGIKLNAVKGTGPNGRVVAKDVTSYLEKTQTVSMETTQAGLTQPTGEVEKVSLSGRRKSIAKNMRKCFETMAPLTVFAQVDVTELLALRQKYVNSAEILGCKISLNDLMMLATVKMLKKHPMLNATFDGETISVYPYVNLGMAVGLAEGLVVPVLKNADQHSLITMSKGLRDLALRAKEDILQGGEQTGATFTVTNVGMFHIDFGTPVISPPQVGILGFGATKRQLVEVDGVFVPRSMMHIMLTFDHRVFDGREAGEVLGDMKALLEHPELILV